jgi:thioredoxin reductase
MYDLIVIGGGPAALAAAFYATGKHLDVVMIYEELGGKIGWLQSLAGPGEHPYLPGNELAHLLTIRTITQARRTIDDRVRAVTRDAGTFQVSTGANGTLEGRAVLIATGAAPIPLRVPGAEHLLEHGLGYSITTYAHLVAGQRIAIIGDSTRALSGAAEIAQQAAQVFVITPNTLPRELPLVAALCRQPNVALIEGAEVRALRGATSLEALSVATADGVRELAVDRAFAVLGVVPNSECVRGLADTTAGGFVLINAYHETSTPGLYAAGDVSTLFSEQVLVAIGDGARAAMNAYDYLLAQALVPT